MHMTNVKRNSGFKNYKVETKVSRGYRLNAKLVRKFTGVLAVAVLLTMPLMSVNKVSANNALYEISASGAPTVTGTQVQVDGTSSANFQTGADDTQHMAVDWDEDQDNNPITGVGWEVAPDGGMTFSPTFSGSANQRGFLASWSAVHNYSGPGTYNITIVVYHGQPVGQDGSDLAKLNFEIIIEQPPSTSEVTVCKTNDSQTPLSGWTVSLDGATDFSGTTAAQTGCAVFNEVPFGSYTLGEIMLGGWTNVSGNGSTVTVDGSTENFVLVNRLLAACEDGQDNDGDGLTDLSSDPGCSSASDNDETDSQTPTQCSDGLDNDQDGNIDFPNDPGCEGAGDDSEQTRFTLTITTDAPASEGNGVVTGTGGINCDTNSDGDVCSQTYVDSTAVDLTALADEGSTFVGSWATILGDPGNCTGNTTPCQVTVNGNITLNAHFSLNTPRRSGGGGGGNNNDEPEGQVLGDFTSIPFQEPGKVLAAELPRTGMPVDAVSLLLVLAGLSLVPAFRRKQA
jgi:hypothetical protein